MNWERFDRNIDLEGLQADVKEAEENSGDFEEVPVGTYEVVPEKMELTETKETHKPMVTIWWKIQAGKYKGQLIFYNQVCDQAFQLSIVKKFLTSLDCKKVEFKSYAKLAQDIEDIKNQIDENNLSYALKYGKNNKGYNTYKIEDVYEG